MYLKESHSCRTILPFDIGLRDDSKGCPIENEIIRAIMRFQLTVIGGERLGMGMCFLGGQTVSSRVCGLCYTIVSVRASTFDAS